MNIVSRHVSAPRGATITCKGWPQEAALRMLMNNLDPDVAERPDDLVVYGGIRTRRAQLGRPSTRSSRRCAASSTTRRSSCSPASRSPSSARIPGRRACSSPTRCSCRRGRRGRRFRDLEDRGLTMYGQMTAGSWIYIGTQGILQGTYETLAALARRHFGGTLRGPAGRDRRPRRHGRRAAARRHDERRRRARGRSRSAAHRAPAGDRLRRRARAGPRRRRSRASSDCRPRRRRAIDRARRQRRRRPARAGAPRRRRPTS